MEPNNTVRLIRAGTLVATRADESYSFPVLEIQNQAGFIMKDTKYPESLYFVCRVGFAKKFLPRGAQTVCFTDKPPLKPHWFVCTSATDWAAALRGPIAGPTSLQHTHKFGLCALEAATDKLQSADFTVKLIAGHVESYDNGQMDLNPMPVVPQTPIGFQTASPVVRLAILLNFVLHSI
jgi:hypothetical protein